MSPTDRPKAVACFPADEIRMLLLGRAAGEATDRLARHVAECPRCAAVVEAIGLDSGIVSGLRRDALPPAPSDHELADVVARISRIDRSSWSGGAAATDDVPARLGPYRLIERLGTGGMGVVYRAEDSVLHRFVAVKVVKGSADADTRARFVSEARALAAVRHDNVVTVHYVGEEPTATGAIPYMAMELLEGQTLHDWMAAAPLPPIDWVVRVGRQIAAGLAFAHGAGLVHRDVKPANLWLEAPQGWAGRPPEARPALAAVGRVKLLDFGLAHPPGVAMGVRVAGTLAYMSPEQARDEAVDARTDLFGLGCVLYELCTNRLAFPQRGRGWAGDRDAPPAPVRSLNPAVPERLADLIERLLAENRADRPGSARAVELELAALDPSSPGPPTLSGQADATVVMPPTDRHPKRLRRLVAPVALLVAAGAVAAVARINRTDATHNSPADGPAPQSAAATEATEPPLTDQQKALASADTIDAEWVRALSAQPPQQQLIIVLRTLGKLNPKFEWSQGSGWVEPDRVIRLTVNADTASDLRPVQALTQLSVLRCRGSAPGLGTVTDLSPVAGLKLKELHCRNNPDLRDLSAIRPDQLEFLDASFTGLETLTELSEAPLVTLKISGTPVRDLGPVRKMSKLRVLTCIGCSITNFEPLTALSLRELNANVQMERDAAVLKRIHTLEKINDVPVTDFWKRHSAPAPN